MPDVPANVKSWSARRRMAEALERVVKDGHTISEAARQFGVSRPRLSEKVKAYRTAMANAEERSTEARLERAGIVRADELDRSPATGVNERRRVPKLKEFHELYFGNRTCGDCGDVRHETPDFHKEMMDMFSDKSIKRGFVNVAPYHAKSTIGSLEHPLQCIAEDPNVRIALISAGEDLARDQVGQIQMHLEDPVLYEGQARNLIEDWGPFKGTETWNRKEFWVEGRTKGHRDPTVRAYGLGSKVYGRRIDEMVLDDVFDERNSANTDTTAFNVKWITNTLGSRLGKVGRMMGVGTRVSPQDGWKLLGDLPGFKVIRYPCIIDEEAGRTLWPDHFDINAAKSMRAGMKLDDWMLLYQNTDTLGADAAFTQEMLDRCHDRDRIMGPGGWNPSWHMVAGVDLAGANKQSGYTAMILLGVNLETGKRYLVDMVNHLQMKAPQMKAQLFDWAQTYHGSLKEIRAENNGVQSQLVQYNDEIIVPMANRHGIRVVGHNTGGNKWDPQFGVESMSPMFYNGGISIPWGDIRSRGLVKHLEEQLLQFPIGQVTDLYMALWFAELGCRELHQRSLMSLFNPNAKVPKRMRNRRRVVDFATGTVRAPTDEELQGWTPRWGPASLFRPEEVKPLNVGREDVA